MKDWLIKKLGGITRDEYSEVWLMATNLQEELDNLWYDEELEYFGKKFVLARKRDKYGRYAS